MYNAEVKSQFIAAHTNGEKWTNLTTILFDRIEPYENEWGCDICNQSASEIERVLGEVTGIRAYGQRSKKVLILKYLEWCIRMGYRDPKLPMPDLDNIGYDRLRRSTVSGPTQLQAYLDGCCVPESMNTTDNIVRCALWLAFSGLTFDKALQMTASNIDFDEMLIHYDDRDYPIYRESIKAFKACVTLKVFEIKNGRHKVPRIDGDQLLRSQSMATAGFLQNRISQVRVAAKDNPAHREMTYKTAWLSGIFYRAYEKERAGGKPDFMEAAFEMTDGKVYVKRGGIYPIEKMQRKMANDFYTDYERWKAVYSV